MIVWGGNLSFSSSIPTNTGAMYDPVADTWSATPSVNAPSAREGHAAIWTGDLMVIWGGKTVNTPLNSGGRLDPVANTWTPTGPAGIPEGRNDAHAIWTGTQLIIWGGWTDRTLFSSGSRYDPALHLWSPISTLNSGDGGTAVWTGSAMIVWGGRSNAAGGAVITYSGLGGTYYPLTDSWVPTSTAGAPSSRSGHTAVWTGSRMLVWGGFFVQTPPGITTYFNDGGLYDPATDTWSAVTTTGAPSARRYPQAVWSGSQVLLWGGEASGDAFPNAGARYDPVANSWTPMSTVPGPGSAGAPGGRTAFASVWTGSRMLVWGGHGFGVQGAKYDPVLDTWSPMAPTPTGTTRDGPGAVFTGKEMMIWGGYDSAVGFTKAGWRYDVTTDAWSSTTLTNAPWNLYFMSVAWGDDSMFVWGGYDNGAPLNTGGRYCACTNTTFYLDSDGDGIGDSGESTVSCSQPAGYSPVPQDCNDSDPAAWQTPSEARDLLSVDNATFSWQPPAAPGGSAIVYDVLRSADRADFVTTAECIATDSSSTLAVDPALPPPGGIYYYLVRAQSGCVPGEGELGTSSNGTPRSGRHCP
jgi:N-acetylneuraminic acid mutarotase